MATTPPFVEKRTFYDLTADEDNDDDDTTTSATTSATTTAATTTTTMYVPPKKSVRTYSDKYAWLWEEDDNRVSLPKINVKEEKSAIASAIASASEKSVDEKDKILLDKPHVSLSLPSTIPSQKDRNKKDAKKIPLTSFNNPIA